MFFQKLLITNCFYVFILSIGMVLTPIRVAGMSVLQIDILPVVVHVIHTGTAIGSPDNPSDSMINEMVELMNDAFLKNGPLYGGANIELAFELANQSPECETTTGINRINGTSVSDYVTCGITTDTL